MKLKHVLEIHSRFHAEMRAIQAMPRVLPDHADDAFTRIEEALEELGQAEEAHDLAAYERSAEKLRSKVAHVHSISKSLAAVWERFESASNALQT
ncbi:MAG: hypothetical protein ACREE6_04520, partial [Limisphaerales bacterium]